MILTAGGIASVIATGRVLGILLSGCTRIMDFKNVHNNIVNCKYAYESCQHLNPIYTR